MVELTIVIKLVLDVIMLSFAVFSQIIGYKFDGWLVALWVLTNIIYTIS